MKLFILALKLLVASYLCYLLYVLAFEYDPASPGFSPPFILFITDTINLFIHEAGHFFLRPFGMWIFILGGSLIQCLLPLALLIVTWRTSMAQIPLPGFWLGENLVNVSVYIRDAPFKHLRLLARGLIHDWNWLLSGDPDLAEPLADAVFGLGIVIIAAAVGLFVYFALLKFREEERIETPDY